MKINEIAMAFAMPVQLLLAAAPCVTVVPFGCVNNLIVIQASVDEKEGFFILDTGTPDLTLNTLYFFGEPTENVFYGVNGEAIGVQVKHVSLNIGDFKKITEAKIIDFTAIEAYTGLPVFGAIGNRVFEDCEVVFDYIFKEFTIYCLDKNGALPKGRMLHETYGAPVEILDFIEKGSMPTIQARIGGRVMRLGLDSGAGINVVDERNKPKIESYLKNAGKKMLASFGTTAQMTSIAQLDSVSVGNIQCAPMKISLIPLKKLNRDLAGPEIDGIMGYEFLSRYRTAINFRKKQVKIWDTEFVREQLVAAKSEEIKR